MTGSNQIKKICIAFLGHPDLDTRVSNLSESLREDGHNVDVIGFNFRDPKFETLKLIGKKVYKLEKKRIPFTFYFKFLFYLWFNLKKYKADIYIAEDVYTLPLMYYFAKKRKAKIWYNSREIYAHLAGLRNKKFVQKIISKIENDLIGKVDLVLTTGEMDTEFLKEQYSLENIITIRNLPKFNKIEDKFDFKNHYNLPENTKIILYQGVLLEGRGIIPVIKSMSLVENVAFILLGDGEFKQKFVDAVYENKVEDKVKFFGSVSQEELGKYTAGADLGLSLIENISVSYYYALPNKLFEYIMAELPVLVSDLPQMKKIVEENNVGKVVSDMDEKAIADAVNSILNDKEEFNKFKGNCRIASSKLNWESEYKILGSYLK